MNLLDIFSLLLIIFGCIVGFRLGLKRSLARLGCFFIFVFGGFLFAEICASLLYDTDFSFLDIKIQGLRLRTIPGFLRALVAVYFPDYSDHVNEAYFLNLFIFKFSKAIMKVPLFLFCILGAVPIIEALFFKKIIFPKEEKIANKILAAVVGCLQSIILLSLFLSPLNGILNIKKEISAEQSFNDGSLAMNLSGHFFFDRLFQTRYKKEEICFRKDIAYFITIRIKKLDPETLLAVLENAETTELIAPAFVELFLLSKNVPLDKDLLEDLKTIAYRKEIANLNKGYQLYRSLDLKKYHKLDVDVIKELAAVLSECRMMDILFPYLIGTYFPDISVYIDDIYVKDIVWTKEIRIFGEIYEIGRRLMESGDQILKYNKEDVIKAVELLFSSSLFRNNAERIFNLFAKDFLPENLHQLEIGNPEAEEIINIFLFARFLDENGFFSKDFSNTKFFTDANIEKTVAYISGSRLLTANLDKILPFLFSKSSLKIEEICLPDIDWKSPEGKSELRCFFEFLRIFSEKEEFRNEALYYSEVFLSKGKIPALLYVNGEKIIAYLLRRLFGNNFILQYETDWRSEAGKKKLLDLIRIYRELVRINLIYTESLAKTSDEDLVALGYALHEAELFRDNLNSILKYAINQAGISFAGEGGFSIDAPSREETVRLLLALKATAKVRKEKDILKLNSDEIETVLASEIIVAVFKNFLYELEAEGNFHIDLSESKEVWIEELRNLLLALKRIYEKNRSIDIKNIDLNIIHTITTGNVGEETDDLSLILKSKILTKTIIEKIKQLEKDRNSGEGIFIIDIQEEDWLDESSNRPGELRNFIRGIQIIYRKLNIDLNNPVLHRERLKEISAGMEDTNGDGIIDDSDDNELREIVKSKILADTIIFFLYEEIV